jgi:hypothetical protein
MSPENANALARGINDGIMIGGGLRTAIIAEEASAGRLASAGRELGAEAAPLAEVVAPNAGGSRTLQALEANAAEEEAAATQLANREASIQAMAKKPDIKQIDRIVTDEGLSLDQRELLHEEITGQGYTLQEIREIAQEIKHLYTKN